MATNLTLKWVKGQDHGMVPTERPYHKVLHAKYQCSLINTSEDTSQVKVFVTPNGKENTGNVSNSVFM